MITNETYTAEVQADYTMHGIGDFELEEGWHDPGPAGGGRDVRHA